MRRIHTSLLVALASLLPLVASGCANATPATPTATAPLQAQPLTGVDPTAIGVNRADLCLESQVVRDGKVTPATVTVKAPCRIMFTNRDEKPIQITGQGFQIGPLGKDESWVQSFPRPGSYAWADAGTPAIAGTIVVQ